MKLKILVEADENGQLYIHFVRDDLFGTPATRTEEVYAGVYFDFDAEGRLVGIDITDLPALLGIDRADPVTFDRLIGVKEAAELLGVAKPNFLRDFASKPDFPAPAAELASGRIWYLSDVLDFIRRNRAAPPEGSLGDLVAQYVKLKGPERVAQELQTEVATVEYLAHDHRLADRVREADLTRLYGLSTEAAGHLLRQIRLIKKLKEPPGGGSDEAGRRDGEAQDPRDPTGQT